MSTTAPEQAAPAQVQQVAAPAPVALAAPAGDGPWATDLALVFTDPTERARVDNFLRAKVQPYTTQLEQQVAGGRNAQALWNDLNTDVDTTFAALANEIYGDEKGTAIVDAVKAQLAANEQTGAAVTETDAAAAVVPAALDPRLEKMIQTFEEQQATNQYDTLMGQTVAAPGNEDIDPQNLHPFVAAAQGNFNTAVTMYRQFEAKFKGVGDGTITAEQLGQRTAPPVMGTGDGGAAPSTIPAVPKKETLDQAINSFMADSRAARQAPPVMG